MCYIPLRVSPYMILQQKRMLTLVLLGFLLSPAIGLSLNDPEWEYYKLDYNKSYTDMAEEMVRREIWLQNRMLVEKHNRLADEGYHTYWLKINHFADLTTEERHKITRGLNIEVDLTSGNDSVRSNNTIRLADLPAWVDWRQKGYVTPVKYQGHCGSCYAFSTTGAIEGLHAKRTGRLISLSEQNIVDCTENFGNHGCHGGQMDRAFRYVISNGGIDTEAGYPYMAEVERCHYQSKNKGASISGFVDILPRGDESRLQIAVGTIGPVSVGIDSRTFGFHFYSHGVYSSYSCSSIHLSHAVLIVGYGTDTWGSQYWLVKNSWGKRWGEDGYVRMARNHDNMCGIATLASYPV